MQPTRLWKDLGSQVLSTALWHCFNPYPTHFYTVVRSSFTTPSLLIYVCNTYFHKPSSETQQRNKEEPENLFKLCFILKVVAFVNMEPSCFLDREEMFRKKLSINICVFVSMCNCMQSYMHEYISAFFFVFRVLISIAFVCTTCVIKWQLSRYSQF